MTFTPLSFSVLLEDLSAAIAEIVDPRRASNATRYSLKDIVLGAFSAFFMQSESFLEGVVKLTYPRGRYT